MEAATCDRRSLEEASHAMGTSQVFLAAGSIGPMLHMGEFVAPPSGAAEARPQKELGAEW